MSCLRHRLDEFPPLSYFDAGHLIKPAPARRSQDASSERWAHGDCARIVGAMTGTYPQLQEPFPYYRGVDVHNPLVSPGDDEEIMARFPPTLLISGTRDYVLSSVVSTHAQLVRLGVSTELHVWEGMGRAFMYYPDLPQSREAYGVIARFFGRSLAMPVRLNAKAGARSTRTRIRPDHSFEKKVLSPRRFDLRSLGRRPCSEIQ